MTLFSWVYIASLIACVINVAADFDSDAAVAIKVDLDQALSIPTLSTELQADGFSSQFFLDNQTARTGAAVDFSALGSLQFGLIRQLQSFGSYYHLWAGFDDGSFLGYYEKGNVLDVPSDAFAISYMKNENHSCAENYGIAPPCREYFAANAFTGAMGASVAGSSYDCRSRAWYFKTKEAEKRRWTNMYVDQTTNQPAFAICSPLSNLTTDAAIPSSLQHRPAGVSEVGGSVGRSRSGRVLVGVACTGFLIEDISRRLRETFPDDFRSKGAYIVERSSLQLVGASSRNRSDFYDAATRVRKLATASPNPLISWSSDQLLAGESTFPSDSEGGGEASTTLVRWIQNDDVAAGGTGYSSSESSVLAAGDAYYIKTQDFARDGIAWSLVTVQKAQCPHGFEIDTALLICTECLDHKDSAGGSSRCVLCVEGFYFHDGNCNACPANMKCEGGVMLPYPMRGYWQNMEMYGEFLAEDRDVDAERCIHQNCMGAEDAAVEECFDGAAALETCDRDAICKVGSTGILCGVCEFTYYMDRLTCRECPETKTVSTFWGRIGIIPIIIGAFFVFLLLAFFVMSCDQVIEEYCGKSVTKIGEMVPWIHNMNRNVSDHVSIFTTLKIAYSTAQIIWSIDSQIGMVEPWPSPFAELVELYSFTNLSFMQVVPMACIDDQFNYYHSMAIQCAFPLALTVLLKLLSMVPGSAISFKFWTLVMLSALLPSVSLSLFRFFSEYETADGTKWLTADLSVQTQDEDGNFQDQRGQWTIFVCCMIIIYPLGVPLFFFSLLYSHRLEIMDWGNDHSKPMPDTLKYMSWMFSDYRCRQPRLYSEVLDCLRRIVLCSIIIFTGDSQVVRAIWGAMIGGIWMQIFSHLQPYYLVSTNTIAHIGNLLIVFCFVVAFFLIAEPFDIDKSGFGMVMFVGNIIAILVFIGVTMYKSKKKKERTKEEEKTKRLLTEAEEALEFASSWMESASKEEGDREELKKKATGEASALDVVKVGGAKTKTKTKANTKDGPYAENTDGRVRSTSRSLDTTPCGTSLDNADKSKISSTGELEKPNKTPLMRKKVRRELSLDRITTQETTTKVVYGRVVASSAT